jgi:hypothetical protein
MVPESPWTETDQVGTSGETAADVRGVTNLTILGALVERLGKPISESNGLCIPTAQWGHLMGGPVSVRGFISATPPWGSMTSLAWRTLGVLELTALPTIGPSLGCHGFARPTRSW